MAKAHIRTGFFRGSKSFPGNGLIRLRFHSIFSQKIFKFFHGFFAKSSNALFLMGFLFEKKVLTFCKV